MAERIQFYEQIKGSFQQNEDWWHLVIEDDGTTHVEHEWSHVDPYGKRSNDTGTQRIPVDEYLAGGADAAAKDKLIKLLAEKEL